MKKKEGSKRVDDGDDGCDGVEAGKKKLKMPFFLFFFFFLNLSGIAAVAMPEDKNSVSNPISPRLHIKTLPMPFS